MGNGCGPEKAIKIFGKEIRPPHHIFFEASCNIHDDNYTIGGNEDDRLRADRGFLKYIIKDVFNLKWYRWPQIPYFLIWCGIYYIGVRIGGKKHFNYKNNDR